MRADRIRWSGRRITLAAALSLAALASLAACGDDDDDVTRPGSPGIGLELDADDISLIQGASGTVGVTVTRSGGFTGAVDLELSGAPTGVTASFTPPSVATGAESSTLTLSVSATVAPGDYPLTITGSGDGIDDESVSLALTVTAAPNPILAIQLAAPTLTVVQGQSGSVGITISRGGGFTGDVTLAVTGTPAGVIATAAPSTVPAGATSATLSVSPTLSAAPSSYAITVTASGAGVATQTASLTLTVTAASTAAIGVEVRGEGAGDLIWTNQGASHNWEVVVTRSGGFAGAVDLTIEGLPQGVTASFTPSTLAPSAGTSRLTITAGAGAALGTTAVTMRAKGAGVADATVIAQLSVVP